MKQLEDKNKEIQILISKNNSLVDKLAQQGIEQ